MAPDSNLVLDEETTAGNYFVSNYPPYSFWSEANIADAHAALDRPPAPGTPYLAYTLQHPFLPQALYILLLQGLHRQKRVRDRILYGRRDEGTGDLLEKSLHRRP